MRDYHLLIAFEDGKSGVFDMGDYLGLPLFAPLRSVALFNRAFVDEGTVAWSGENYSHCRWQHHLQEGHQDRGL